MELLVVVIALAFIQIWGARNPLHNDSWFYRWLRFSDSSAAKNICRSKYGVLLCVGVPVAIFWLAVVVLIGQSVWILLPVSVAVLLYSFGRGEFSEIVREYTQACYIDDWPSSIQRAENIGVNTQNIDENDWLTLHQCVLDEAAYRGFERMFAVLFWFFLLGPVAALAYRLLFVFVHSYQANETSSLSKDEVTDVAGAQREKSSLEADETLCDVDGSTPEPNQDENESDISSESERDTFAKKCLWVLEWPAIRLLSLTFALTGNFAASAQQWSEGFMASTKSTKQVASRSVMGALSISDELDKTCEVTRKELCLLARLFTRTLWLWLGLVAVLFMLT